MPSYVKYSRQQPEQNDLCDSRGLHFVVTTATSLHLNAAPLCCGSGSSSSSLPKFGFSATSTGRNGGFVGQNAFCKVGFLLLQLLQTNNFFKKNQYSKGFQHVTTHPQKSNVVTFLLQSCNILLQVVTNRVVTSTRAGFSHL